MGDKSPIEWTEATWNPVTGCDRISAGCDHCYALTLAKRLKGMGQANYQTDGDPRTSGPGFGVATHEHMLDQPIRWKRPRMIFVNSMSDLFHADVPDEFIARVFAVMAIAQHHTFQVLTKRPQRMAKLTNDPTFRCTVHAMIGRQLGIAATPDEMESSDGVRHLGQRLASARKAAGLAPYVHPWPLPNVWLGTTIETGSYAFRADHLRASDAVVRFISFEPLLSDAADDVNLTGIDWAIVGGESGPGARPMHPTWARDLRDRCVDEGVAFHFKQWGNWLPTCEAATHRVAWSGEHYPNPPTCLMSNEELIRNVGKHAAGRRLDGRTWDEFPQTVDA